MSLASPIILYMGTKEANIFCVEYNPQVRLTPSEHDFNVNMLQQSFGACCSLML